jgi:hypothetical protein
MHLPSNQTTICWYYGARNVLYTRVRTLISFQGRQFHLYYILWLQPQAKSTNRAFAFLKAKCQKLPASEPTKFNEENIAASQR